MDTLKDLADHCYQQWLTTNQPALTPGAIEWIRNDLGEQKLSDEVRQIFTARIHGSEKCYRFLKLMGVIERDRLRRLLKKQVLDEIEVERAQRLREIEAQFHEKVNEQRQRVLRRPSEGAMPFWLLMIGAALVSAVLGGMVYASIGWSLGALVGGGVTCGYRIIRTSGLVDQFVSSSQQGLADKRRAVEADIEDRKSHIDDEAIKLEFLCAGPITNTLREDLSQPLFVSAPNTMRYLMVPAAVTLVLMILPVFVSTISLFQKGPGNSLNQSNNIRDTYLRNIYGNPEFKKLESGTLDLTREDYSIEYYPPDDSFTIIPVNIVDNPKSLKRKRIKAENDFVNLLGITKRDACQLRVNLSVPRAVLPDEITGIPLNGMLLGLSFCPDGKPLPDYYEKD